MKSRMEKYYNEQTDTSNSRSSRNRELYKDVTDSELEDFNLNSNVSILGDNNGQNIDINKIQEILNQKYNDQPKRKPIMQAEALPIETLDLSETREYDINSIMEKAKEQIEPDYEVERLKKLRNTQFDILSNLNLEEEKKEIEEEISPEQTNLMNLINTITSKEMASQIQEELDPLDMFAELKGNDSETVVGAINEEGQIIDFKTPVQATKEYLMNVEESKKEEIKIENKDEVKKEEEKKDDKKIDNSFYTNSVQFAQSDFDDFNDLKDDMQITKIVIKVLIVLVIIAFLVGCVFLANNLLNLGLF